MAMFKNQKPKKKAASKKQPTKQAPQSNALAQINPPEAVPAWEPKPFTPPVSTATGIPSPIMSKPKFDPEKEFLKTFKSLTYRHRAWDIWNDFIIMAACALSNPVDKGHYAEREARYLRIINKYNKEEQSKFPSLFAHLVLAMELNPEQDFLGKLYTSLNLHDEGRKQHFTPYSICGLMAEITMQDVAKQVKESGYVTINDPCCGAGATLIAAVHSAKRSLAEIGLNFQNHILVAAQDIDETVALMCYIQLSLLGVAAYIKVGNALTEPMSTADTTENYWFTPVYFSDVWAMRRLARDLDSFFRTPKLEKKPFKLRIKLEKKDCQCSLPQFYEKVAKKAGFLLTNTSRFDCTKIHCTKPVQDAIFDFYIEVSKGDGLGVAMLWVDSGPKTDMDEDQFLVEIEDGFIIEGEEEMDSKFELGQLIVTESVDARMRADHAFDAFVKTSLGQFKNCDWGTLCDEDKEMCNESVKRGDRMIMGSYKRNDEEIWIITEWDRSATTIMFPHER